MYDSGFPSPVTPPPPPPLQQKHSKLGIASFILAILSLLLFCLFFIFAYMLGSSTGGMATSQSMSVVVWIFICLIVLSTAAGVGLGIAALTQQAQSKVFGILGLIFNALILIGFCIFMLFAVVLAASMMSY